MDRDKVVLSGFSAGGNLATVTALALALGHTGPKTATAIPSSSIKIRGVVAFYPVFDMVTPRPAKLTRMTNPKLAKPLPKWMASLFDTSYLPDPSIDRSGIMISPLRATDEELKGFPNFHGCLCGADVLGPEGQEFGDRLRILGDDGTTARLGVSANALGSDGEKGKGRDVVTRWVEGARHGWDKPPFLVQQSVLDEYQAAGESIKRWCM